MSLGPVMLDLEGTDLTVAEETLLKHPLVGGVIYFARNYQSVAQITDLSAAIRAIRPELLIAVDQEGGRVQRFQQGFTRLPAMQRFLPLFQKNPQSAVALLQDVGWLMASELLACGIDFSFAPVLDVDDCHCQVIADRAFSKEPNDVVQLAGSLIAGMHEAGMAATGKHFPGHGSVRGDSHLELPEDPRDFETIKQHDLQPFTELTSELDAIMPAHILFPEVDPNHAVGFSATWLQDILRQQMHFDGVIFSDDLTMEGAAIAGSFGARARQALTAGCNMVLVCNHRQGALEVLDALAGEDVSKAVAPLNTMSARQQPEWSTLKQSTRWQRTAAIMNAMTGTQ